MLGQPHHGLGIAAHFELKLADGLGHGGDEQVEQNPKRREGQKDDGQWVEDRLVDLAMLFPAAFADIEQLAEDGRLFMAVRSGRDQSDQSSRRPQSFVLREGIESCAAF